MIIKTSFGILVIFVALFSFWGSFSNADNAVKDDSVASAAKYLTSQDNAGEHSLVKRSAEAGKDKTKKKFKKKRRTRTKKKTTKNKKAKENKKRRKKGGRVKKKKTKGSSKQNKNSKRGNRRRKLRRKKKKETKNKNKKSGNQKKKRKGKKKTRSKKKKQKTRKQRNKDKLKKRLRRKKKTLKRNNRKNGKQSGRQTGSCQNLTCLTALVGSLKIEKDLVRNFLAQEKRIDSKTTLMAGKQNKSRNYEATATFLEKRLGETKDHKFTGIGPLCKGIYNDSNGLKASEVAHKLEDCNKTIVDACSLHLQINETVKADLKTCKTLMHAFKNESELCQNQSTNCACWTDLQSKTAALKKCNIANKLEIALNKDYKNCKAVFINCSKKEDEALEYMVNCYTSQSQVKANIKELLKIRDSANKLKKNHEAIVNSSKTNNAGRLQRSADELSRQKKTKRHHSC